MASGIKTAKSITQVAKKLKKAGEKIVFTNGCFDILHYGHVKYLEKCRSLGDLLVVGLNSDSSLRRLKGKNRPVTGQNQRAAILLALRCVDYVVIFKESTPKKLIENILPNVLAKGGDWKKKDIVGASSVEKAGGRVVSVSFVKGYSTSKILRRIKNG